MKVLIISHMYPSAVNPSYGIFVHKQAAALRSQGCEIAVVSPVPFTPWPLPLLRKKWNDYASVPRRDFIAGMEVFYPRYLEFPGSYFLDNSGFFMYLGMKRLLKKLRSRFPFELVHAHVALPDGQAASYLKKKYNTPLVVTVHGQDFQSTIRRNARCREKVFEVLGNADRIITVSTKLKNIVRDEPFSSKIEVIHNGVDPADSGPGTPGNDSPGRTILSVSNLKKTKGIDLNIRAVSALRNKYPDLKYYIIGDGQERRNLEKLTNELGLEENVIFLGQQDHSEVMKKMAKADIFCLPSWQEGFGVVYIEAMLQGKPVIGVEGEGISDILRHNHNGLLVKPKDVEDLTGALDALLSDPIRAKALGRAAKEDVINNCTWDRNARRTLEVYQEVLANNN